MTGVEAVLPFLADGGDPETVVLAVEPLVARLRDRPSGAAGGGVRYTSPAFAEASRFVSGAGEPPTPGRAAAAVLRDPRAAVATAALIARLPTVEVPLSHRPDGLAIRAVLEHRRLVVPSGRLARAVLRVPATVDDYLRGRSRQAVRTNVGHARGRGVTCRSVDDVAERVRLALDIVGDRSFAEHITREWLDRVLGSGEMLLAEAADGTPLVFTSLVVDVRCAYLRAFMASQDHDDATLARYLLHLHAVTELAKAGVTHLLGDCALRVPPGARHFQHLAGFTAANVRVRPFEA